jgi:hypothetical protein
MKGSGQAVRIELKALCHDHGQHLPVASAAADTCTRGRPGCSILPHGTLQGCEQPALVSSAGPVCWDDLALLLLLLLLCKAVMHASQRSFAGCSLLECLN